MLDKNSLADMKVYYGKKEVTVTNGISIDLAAGQSFDASKVSVTYKAEDDKTYTLSGDALQAKQNYAIAEYYVRRIHPTQS